MRIPNQLGYYLLQLRPDGTESWDGPHLKPYQVARAKAIIQSLKFLQTGGSQWFCVKIEEVPIQKVKLNKSAIDALNSL